MVRSEPCPNTEALLMRLTQLEPQDTPVEAPMKGGGEGEGEGGAVSAKAVPIVASLAIDSRHVCVARSMQQASWIRGWSRRLPSTLVPRDVFVELPFHI